jgi:hypothetical protein
MKHTIPYGAVLEKLTPDGNMLQFHYLGEPYEGPESEMKSALRELT